MRLLTLLTTACLLFPQWVFADHRAWPQITVVTEDFPPYNYQSGGDAKGLSVEVLKAVLSELQLTPEIRFLPWARAYHVATSQKNVLIFSIARIPEREALFHWVGEIAPYRTSLYKLSRNPLEVDSLEEAKQYDLGVSQQDVIYTFLKSEGFTRLDVIGSDLLNIQKLKYQRIPLIAYDEAAFNFAMRSDANPDAFEQVLSIKPLSGSLYMAFSQGSDPHLVEAFQEALQQIKVEGRYQKILQRYFDQGSFGSMEMVDARGD